MYTFTLRDPFFLPHAGCDLEFILKKGECLIIVGENGVGKTTLAHRVWMEMQVKNLAFVEQLPLEHFYNRTLLKVKKLFLQSCSSQIRIDFFEELWTGFGLHEKENRFIAQLSGGENQALKLAMSLCGHHEYFMLDEPSQFLDETRKAFLKKIILRLLSENKSVLVIEHDLNWVPESSEVMKVQSINGVISKGATWTT